MRLKSASLFVSLCFSFFWSLTSFSQTMASFEDFGLKPGEHNNNAGSTHAFKSGNIELPNFYDSDFQFWSGWAITADTNTTTPGFLNQYSAIAGEGADKTRTYAIGYIFDPVIIRHQPSALGKRMIGMYVNNSTYSYLSMRDGDAFAKKFGGETGSDPDYFRLTIKKYSGGAIADDSINFYLADYRFPQPEKDYIVSTWTYIDLTTLGEVDSLVLSLKSSDVGAFGMNTPAYVCIDQVSTDNLLAASAADQGISKLHIWPNPAQDFIHFEVPVAGRYYVTSLNGVRMWSEHLEAGSHFIPVSAWSRGIYLLAGTGFPAARICLE